MRNSIISLAVLLGTSILSLSAFAVVSNAQAKVTNQTAVKQVLQSADPSFFPLAPCPTCASPTVSKMAGSPSGSPATGASTTPASVAPSAAMEPCDNSQIASDNRHKSKHKKHRGAISGGMEKVIEFLIKLLNMLLELLGGSPIQSPQTPEEPEVSESPESPEEPEDPETPDISQAPEEKAPCDPGEGSGNDPSSAPQPSGAQSAQPSSAMSVPSGAAPSGSAQPAPSGTPSGTSDQKLGCGGVPAPATTEPLPADGAITSGGTAGSPKVYDGACKQAGTITIKADYVTVQNFMIVASGQYGIQSEGTGNTIQNNDIKGVHASGDGDLNAITFFGNDTKILYNTAIDFVTGSPGGSHTDGIQTWISDSHPTGSTKVLIKGNKFTGPANPSRSNDIPSIHQCIMAEGPGKGGNSGGSGTSGDWEISDNYFSDSWNQCIKLDGINNVTVTRNEFAGSSDKVMDIPSSTVQFLPDNKVTGQYKNGVGM